MESFWEVCRKFFLDMTHQKNMNNPKHPKTPVKLQNNDTSLKPQTHTHTPAVLFLHVDRQNMWVAYVLSQFLFYKGTQLKVSLMYWYLCVFCV